MVAPARELALAQGIAGVPQRRVVVEDRVGHPLRRLLRAHRLQQVLLAPGGRQMLLRQRGGEVRVQIDDGNPALHYKPCADITLESVASTYGGKTLAMILTGMGADGREGVRKLKQRGAMVWTQDEASCVIYGMPAAVEEAGLSDQVLPLRELGPALVEAAGA